MGNNKLKPFQIQIQKINMIQQKNISHKRDAIQDILNPLGGYRGQL